MAENNAVENNGTPVQSRRDKVLGRLRTKYPDKSFDDDESIYSAVDDDYDEYDRQIEENGKNEKAFSDMFNSDPRSVAFLMDWKNGESPTMSLVRRFGSDIVSELQDPEVQDKLAEANKEYLDRVAKEKEYEQTYEKNFAESCRQLDEMQEREGYTDEQINDALKKLFALSTDLILGKFSPEQVKSQMKADNYDKDVEQAGYEGEIKGRNAKIEEQLRKPSKGDGTSVLNGKNNVQGPRKSKSIFDLANDAM